MSNFSVTHLLEKASRHAESLRRLPESTYRLQFHAGFTFQHATAIIPYLADLGITHVYASPYLRAAPGSTHGYDVIDHCRLNPEFGTQADYEAFIQALADHGMNHILDTVPNHVGIATNENTWWNDVLENGPASRYGNYFDIAWRDSPRPELHDRVLVPILGDAYAKVLEQGQLQLQFDAAAGSFSVAYFQRQFPINPRTYDRILVRAISDTTGPQYDEYQSIITAIQHLPDRSQRDPALITERHRETAAIKHRLAALTITSKPIRDRIEQAVISFNGTAGDPGSFDALDDLLTRQCYRLAYWHIASDEINYRRFFDINDLAALVMERPEVFEETHALTLQLLAEGKVAGLRIDHPDGLYDPEEYFRRLQTHFIVACAQQIVQSDPRYSDQPWEPLKSALLEALSGENFSGDDPNHLPLYVVAEKILAVDERLPRDWAIHGTSGYHFLNMINGLFVDADNAEPFTRLYQDITGQDIPFEELVYQKQRLVLDTAMGSELQMLAHRLSRLARKHRRSRDFTHNGLREALAETIACFPVYRTYITSADVNDIDRQRVDAAIEGASQRNPRTEPDLFQFIRDTILQKYPDTFTSEDRAEQLNFAGKFQQLTAPVTAKGVEDTAFYLYNRLVSLNEVGGDPARFGLAPAALHAYLAARQRIWPYALSALSTHDTKRSEDVRARLNVLSEIPEEWREHVKSWMRMNAPHRGQANGMIVPTPDEEYLLYQALIGAWPTEPYSADEYAAFIPRVQAYMLKAMREAKVNTSWTEPDVEHEKAVNEFIGRILDEKASGEFLADFRPFYRQIAHHGLLNSLSQTLLKLTCPGAPDTYQGTELWDFSLVDPDNRRPVDYARRRSCLDELKTLAGGDRLAAVRELIDTKEDGRVKLWITWHALQCRRRNPGLFSGGHYTPLESAGAKAQHVFAFSRRLGDRLAVIAVPRLVVELAPEERRLPLGAEAWHDTRLALRDTLPNLRLTNVFTGQSLVPNNTSALAAADIFAHLPIALLISD